MIEYIIFYHLFFLFFNIRIKIQNSKFKIQNSLKYAVLVFLGGVLFPPRIMRWLYCGWDKQAQPWLLVYVEGQHSESNFVLLKKNSSPSGRGMGGPL